MSQKLFYSDIGGEDMSDAIMVPLQVYGIGFLISMGIAVLIKLLMDAIKSFSKTSDQQE